MLGAQMIFFQQFISNKSELIAAKDHPDMPSKVREVLEDVGNNLILRIQLGRTPVQEFPIKLLNFLSDSKFQEKQLELGYDEIYHNYLLITIENSQRPNVLQHILRSNHADPTPRTILKLEKAQRIALKPPIVPDELIDVYEIPLTPSRPLTLNRLISVASNFDKNFFVYDVAENNMCQTFVENILRLNGLMSNIVDQATLDALRPIDAKALISTLGDRSGLVKKATDLGAKFDKLINDRRIKLKKPNANDSGSTADINVISSETSEAIYRAILTLEKQGRKVDQ